MTEAQLKTKKNELLSKQKSLSTKIKKLNELYMSCNEEIESITGELLEIEEEKISSQDEFIKFYLHCDGSSTGMEHYRKAQTFFESMGFASFGYNVVTEQKSLSFSLNSNKEDNDKIYNSIQKMIQHMKPYDLDGTKCMRFGISEKTLGEYGIYQLIHYVDEHTWAINKMTYGTSRIVKKFNTLMESLNYISDNLSYD